MLHVVMIKKTQLSMYLEFKNKRAAMYVSSPPSAVSEEYKLMHKTYFTPELTFPEHI